MRSLCRAKAFCVTSLLLFIFAYKSAGYFGPETEAEAEQCLLENAVTLHTACFDARATKDDLPLLSALSRITRTCGLDSVASGDGADVSSPDAFGLFWDVATFPWYQRYLEVFQNETGLRIGVRARPISEYITNWLGMWPNSTNPGPNDYWLIGAEVFGEDVDRGAFLDLSGVLQLDASYSASAVPVSFRHAASAAYAGAYKAIPLWLTSYQLMYRRDLFAEQNFPVPNTWDEALTVASQYARRQVGPSNPQYAFCFESNPACGYGHAMLMYIVASMVQTDGAAQGFWFDTDTMEPLYTTAAMREAIRIYRALRAYSVPFDTPCNQVYSMLASGQCLMLWGFSFSFKRASHNSSALYGRQGVAHSPGSYTALDRRSGALRPCTKALCPLAVPVERVAGQRVETLLVNRIVPFDSATFAINAFAPLYRQAAAFAVLHTFAGEANHKKLMLVPRTEITPIRYDELDDSLWTEAGYAPDDVRDFLAVYQQSFDSANILYELRIPGVYKFYTLIHTTLIRALTENVTYEQLEPSLIEGTNAITESVGGKARLRDLYRRSLDYKPLMEQNKKRVGPSEVILIAVLVPTLGTLVALSAALWGLLRRRRRRRDERAARLLAAPGAGPLTTLVVTDIQDSTCLWESLPAEVMDTSVKLHHRVIRGLLLAHHGYESATEGDSFILAFHRPDRALGFALAAQEALLTADWPPGLLDSPYAPTLLVGHDAAACAAAASYIASPALREALAGDAAGGGSGMANIGRMLLPRSEPATSEAGGASAKAAAPAPLPAPEPGRHPPACPQLRPPWPVSGSPSAKAPSGAHRLTGHDMPLALRALLTSAAWKPRRVSLDLTPRGAPRGQLQMATVQLRATDSGPDAFAGGGGSSARGCSPPPRHRSNELPEYDASGRGCLIRSTDMIAPHFPTPFTTLSASAAAAAAVASQPAPPPLSYTPRAAAELTGAKAGELTNDLSDMQASGCGLTPTSCDPEPASEGSSLGPGNLQPSCASALGGAGGGCMTLRELLGAVFPEAEQQQQRGGAVASLQFRGLRVRMGLHCGPSPAEVQDNEASARVTYPGCTLQLAKAVGDCGRGGQVTLSAAVLRALDHKAAAAGTSYIVLGAGEHVLKEGGAQTEIYSAYGRGRLARAGYMDGLRSHEEKVPGALSAPLGRVAVAVAQVQDAEDFTGWGLEASLSMHRAMLREAGRLACGHKGYLVASPPGSFQAMFSSPGTALHWLLELQLDLAPSAAEHTEALLPPKQPSATGILPSLKSEASQSPGTSLYEAAALQRAANNAQLSIMQMRGAVDEGLLAASLRSNGAMLYAGPAVKRAACLAANAAWHEVLASMEVVREILGEGHPAAAASAQARSQRRTLTSWFAQHMPGVERPERQHAAADSGSSLVAPRRPASTAGHRLMRQLDAPAAEAASHDSLAWSAPLASDPVFALPFVFGPGVRAVRFKGGVVHACVARLVATSAKDA